MKCAHEHVIEKMHDGDSDVLKICMAEENANKYTRN